MKLSHALVLGISLTAATAAPLVGCGDDDPITPPADGGGTDTGGGDVVQPGDGGPDASVTVAKRPSKSGTIAISDDDALVAMVNPEDGSLTVFKTADDSKLSNVKTGKEPSAVVIAGDNKTAYVANRGDATVVKITGLDTATPTVGAPVPVGSEPTGLALSPTGAKLFVAEFGENKVGVVDTKAMTRSNLGSAAPRAPRAILVTNNGDANDNDETVVVTEFYGEAVAGKEGLNDGRAGKIVLLGADGSDKGSIGLAPFDNTEATFETTTSPNQLAAVAVSGTQVFVPSVSASPRFPLGFNKNVYPVVYVGDLGTKTEVKTPTGTTNLAQLVMALPSPRFFLGELVDIDFVPGQKIAYAVSRAADVVQRIDYSGAAVAIGAPAAKQIDVQGNPSGANPNACHNPTGIAVGTKQKGYVNCWGTRRMAVIDFTSQAVAKVVEAATLPATPEVRGLHFFFTGRGRWSGNGSGAAAPTENGISFSSCGSCHPDGLSDNITWHFAAGPRQTTSMDGTFSHGPGAQKQRIFNWSAIIDEMHDFEANTRGVSGGIGVVTNAPTAGDCGTLAMETRRGTDAAGTLPAALGLPVKEINDGIAGDDDGKVNCPRTDWDDINAYTKTIRPPKGRRFADAAAVARGRTVFTTTARCDKCHSGAGWTISRLDFAPSAATNAQLAADPFPIVGKDPPVEFVNGDVVSLNTFLIQTQQAAGTDPDLAAQGPPQLSCAIRNVASFGVRNTDGSFDAVGSLELEKRATGALSQGFRGFNVPSLYGVSVGGPFLHHGQAKTLEALFTDPRFGNHWKAGNPNFDPSSGTNRADLIAFLHSIDESTAEVAIPSGFDYCQ